VTPIADMIEKMLAAKDPAEAIVAAVRAIESVTQALRVTPPSRDASRPVTVLSDSPAAIRARRARAKRKQNQAQAKANDIASASHERRDGERDAKRDASQSAPTFLSSFSEEVLSDEDRKQGSKRSENTRARGQRMVTGAILTDEYRDAARELGAADAVIQGMWDEFADYWVGVPGQRGVKLDWLATWRNDVRRKLERGNRNGRQQKQSLGDLARDLAEQARSQERESGLFGPDEPIRGH
jgi:hypothetical protein